MVSEKSTPHQFQFRPLALYCAAEEAWLFPLQLCHRHSSCFGHLRWWWVQLPDLVTENRRFPEHSQLCLTTTLQDLTRRKLGCCLGHLLSQLEVGSQAATGPALWPWWGSQMRPQLSLFASGSKKSPYLSLWCSLAKKMLSTFKVVAMQLSEWQSCTVLLWRTKRLYLRFKAKEGRLTLRRFSVHQYWT